METYIALLRGINVGGKNKILMAELRDLLLNMGLKHVQTYIQSGNIIFNSEEGNASELEFQITEAIKKRFELSVPVLVITSDALNTIFNTCPFSEEKKQKSYFSLLYTAPEIDLVNEVLSMKFENEEINILANCVYFYSSIGYGKTKYNNNFFERKLKITATARNYKTMAKLLELSENAS
ncbi:Uncharacterized conserved protein, DUF1697 family [Algibacter lectus]|uniref:DUF1697 domain-containing protein n=1 Tax=Algibacter lectus TaxID=221126 RepID=UPI0008EDB4DE|nr:DUF1697 domain-containing protein [Algibacter lectus]SFD36860.1 Uncharacterized conserved protein, DUF1697 family [Algibacter lectus]